MCNEWSNCWCIQKNLTQSTIRKILKWSSELLEGELHHPSQKRGRIPIYPGLHDALFAWMEAIENHTTFTRNILKAKAVQLFRCLYPGETPLKFSEGWLMGWKEQYADKEYKSHGQSGRAPVDGTQQQMQKIQAVLSAYESCDICNVDKTAYHWQMQSDCGLGTYELAGKKIDKAQITVMVTLHGHESEHELLWNIGSAKNPHCLNNVDIYPGGCQYRYNKAAWVRTYIMIDYLECSNDKVAHRNWNVVLLLDNFLVHESATAKLRGNQALSNIRIQWLSMNTISAFQPDDPGIIWTQKAHTCNRFLNRQVS